MLFLKTMQHSVVLSVSLQSTPLNTTTSNICTYIYTPDKKKKIGKSFIPTKCQLLLTIYVKLWKFQNFGSCDGLLKPYSLERTAEISFFFSFSFLIRLPLLGNENQFKCEGFVFMQPSCRLIAFGQNKPRAVWNACGIYDLPTFFSQYCLWNPQKNR